MSVLRPKDGDYIGRGILLLLLWFCFGWAPCALLGAVTFSFLFGSSTAAAGASIVFFLYIPVGLVLYSRYLNQGLRRSKEN